MPNAIRMVSLRNLAAHKVRLLLTAVSVLLGTAFVAGSFVFTDTLKHSFDNIFSNADKGVDARIEQKGVGPGVPVSLLDQVRALPGVRVVEPRVSLPVVVVGANGKRIKPGGAPSVAGMWTT